MLVSIASASASLLLPGSKPLRRAWAAPAANRPGAEHCRDALDHGGDVDPASAGDLADRIGLKALQFILGNRQDGGVDRISDADRNRGAAHSRQHLSRRWGTDEHG